MGNVYTVLKAHKLLMAGNRVVVQMDKFGFGVKICWELVCHARKESLKQEI